MEESIRLFIFLSYLPAVPTNASNKTESLSVQYLCLPFDCIQTRTEQIWSSKNHFWTRQINCLQILIVRNQNRKFQMFHSLHLLGVRHSVHFHTRNYFRKVVMRAETKRHFLRSASARLIRTNPRHHAAYCCVSNLAHSFTFAGSGVCICIVLYIRNLHVFRFRCVQNQNRIIGGENISFELTALILRSRTGNNNNNCNN